MFSKNIKLEIYKRGALHTHIHIYTYIFTYLCTYIHTFKSLSHFLEYYLKCTHEIIHRHFNLVFQVKQSFMDIRYLESYCLSKNNWIKVALFYKPGNFILKMKKENLKGQGPILKYSVSISIWYKWKLKIS